VKVSFLFHEKTTFTTILSFEIEGFMRKNFHMLRRHVALSDIFPCRIPEMHWRMYSSKFKVPFDEFLHNSFISLIDRDKSDIAETDVVSCPGTDLK
jgi:hypothetical protein